MTIERIYRLNLYKKLHSFNDPIKDLPILEKKLYDWHYEIATKCGLKLLDVNSEDEIQDDRYLFFDNNIFFSYEFLKKVLTIIKNQNASLQFYVEENNFNKRFSLPSKNNSSLLRQYNMFYKVLGDFEQKKEIISQKIYTTSLKLPRQLIKSAELDYDQCDTYITTMISPFHLLFANLYMIVSYRLSKFRKLIPNKFQKRVHDRDPLFFKFLRLINKIGKKCKIHPTAVVEGCIIGNNVIIGANAVVRLSYIGSECIIEDNCTVLYSVLGSKTCIAHNNIIIASMCYDEAYLIHGPYQFSIYGKNSAVFATINCDIRLDQKTVRIITENGIMDSGQNLLGIAFGHRSKVGGGNIIAPGRIVPNDFWVSSPSTIIKSFPFEKNDNPNKDNYCF